MINIYATTSADGLSAEEMELYNLIMAYRAENGLPSIPLSGALTATAGRHVVDTLYNIWQPNLPLPADANLHSWSDRFYRVDAAGTHVNPEYMWEAPVRLGLDYQNAGFEISAAGQPNVAAALAGWQNSPGHNTVILNQGIWANQTWNAIGIGMEIDPSAGGGFGGRIYHVWFGRIADPNGGPDTEGRLAAARLEQDLSGDGTEDILWVNAATNQVGFYEMGGAGAFTWQDLGVAGANYTAVNTGDFNGDLTDDILWHNGQTQQVGYYKMGPNGAFAWQGLGVAGVGYQIAGTGDFNADGTDDILWYNTQTQQVGFYRMADTTFAWQELGLAGANYVIAGTDDFNGDGTDDILWFNTQTRQLGYYEMKNDSFVWKDMGFAGANYEVAGTGQFNGDATDDILWFNTQTRQVGYYAMEHDGTFAWQSLGIAGANYEVVDIGNYDGDGTDDILWFNSQTRQVGYYDVDGAVFSWQSLGSAGANFGIAADEAL